MDRTTIAPGAPDYPAPLTRLAHPPTMRVRGLWPRGSAVAIVGTRQPTPEGANFAFELGNAFAKAGFPVWSGGALGIDTAAHRGALAGGGATAVVLGGGLDRLFPKPNEPLFDEVVRAGGAVLSPFEDDAPPAPFRFHLRNSVLVAMASLVILVECGIPSGALNATRWARSFGVPWIVVPQAPWSPSGAGCAAELERGCPAIASVSSALIYFRRVLELPPETRVPKRRASTRGKVETAQVMLDVSVDVEGDDPVTRAILDALVTAHTLGDVAERLGIRTADLAERLLDLTFAGRVEETSRGVYRRAR